MSVHYPAGPWARIKLNTHNNESQWENDIWMVATGTASPTFDIQAAAVLFDSHFAAPYANLLTASAYYDGADLYYNDASFTRRGESIGYTAGVLSAGALPTEDAVVVTLNAGIGTRKGVGRIFLGGLDETVVSGSRVQTASVTAYNALIQTLVTGWTYMGVTFKLAVWSRSLNVVHAVSFFQTETVLGHQTSRRPSR